MEIFFVRHGQTDMNAKHLVQGQIDQELNEVGKAQAHLAGEFLKQEVFSKIFTSPLVRAKRTAEIIGAFHPLTSIIVDKRITELDLGNMAGKRLKANPHIKEEVYKHPEYYGGERDEEFMGRVKSFYNDLKQLPHKSKILIVAHSGTYVALSKILYNKKLQIPKNGEIVKLGKFPYKISPIEPIEAPVQGKELY